MSAAPRLTSQADLETQVYVWQLPVRMCHWLVFLSVIVLAATGFYIGHPFIKVSGAARDHFVMGTIRVVHLYAAIVFTLSVLLRIYWLFAGNQYARWDQLIPLTPGRMHSLWQMVRFYGFARRDPLLYAGHSALAGEAYAILFLIYLAIIGTGLALYTVYASPGSFFQLFRFLIPFFGGLQKARLFHHIGMWLVLIFMIHHVYSVALFSYMQGGGLVDSMFSGYKRIDRLGEIVSTND
ncbi:MAG TPA: Ni/Fe-hydrogenase, b-type cytochrome subunit [Candidatus Binataceae bacterium]|nr:Ni/Fe-hydrogenase, b-type cytochrome subunit [Candidatus Binataceae bacterium]